MNNLLRLEGTKVDPILQRQSEVGKAFENFYESNQFDQDRRDDMPKPHYQLPMEPYHDQNISPWIPNRTVDRCNLDA